MGDVSPQPRLIVMVSRSPGFLSLRSEKVQKAGAVSCRKGPGKPGTVVSCQFEANPHDPIMEEIDNHSVPKSSKLSVSSIYILFI